MALPGHHLAVRILVAGRTVQRGASTMGHPHHLLSVLPTSSLRGAPSSRARRPRPYTFLAFFFERALSQTAMPSRFIPPRATVVTNSTDS